MSLVVVKRITNNIQHAVQEAMEQADWRRYLDLSRPVLLKPNLGWDIFLPGAVTSPAVIEGVIQTLRPHIKDLRIVESDQVLVRIEKAWRKAKIDRLCEKYGVPFINLSKEPTVTLETTGTVFPQLTIPRMLLEGNILTIPVMKTHDKTTVTGALKNQWGCLPKTRHMYHLVLPQAIAEINAALRPRFAVMDATISLDGNGPKSGFPRITDLVLASADLVACDTIAAGLMGFDSAHIEHLHRAMDAGLGCADPAAITVAGEDIRSINFNFRRPHSNFVSVVELRLRRSRLHKWAFQGPFFWASCRGALVYYFLWQNLVGWRLRRRILRHPLYGSQWQ
jgi:uncharacterized protein (DUF362 family)